MPNHKNKTQHWDTMILLKNIDQ